MCCVAVLCDRPRGKTAKRSAPHVAVASVASLAAASAARRPAAGRSACSSVPRLQRRLAAKSRPIAPPITCRSRVRGGPWLKVLQRFWLHALVPCRRRLRRWRRLPWHPRRATIRKVSAWRRRARSLAPCSQRRLAPKGGLACTLYWLWGEHRRRILIMHWTMVPRLCIILSAASLTVRLLPARRRAAFRSAPRPQRLLAALDVPPTSTPHLTPDQIWRRRRRRWR